MDKLSYLFFTIAVIGMFLGTMGVIGAQNNFDRNTNLTEVINGILEFQQMQTEINENMVLILKSTEYDISELTNKTNDKFIIFQNEIVKIKEDIKNKFPQASTIEQEQQTAIADTPFLTLTMEKTEWTLGATLVFTGTANPNDLVSITVKLPDRKLLYGQALPTDIIGGTYRIEIATEFDHAAGTWYVFAKQGKEQSDTLIFTVE